MNCLLYFFLYSSFCPSKHFKFQPSLIGLSLPLLPGTALLAWNCQVAEWLCSRRHMRLPLSAKTRMMSGCRRVSVRSLQLLHLESEVAHVLRLVQLHQCALELLVLKIVNHRKYNKFIFVQG